MCVGDVITMNSQSLGLPMGIIIEIRQVDWCTVMWHDGEIQNLGSWEIKLAS